MLTFAAVKELFAILAAAAISANPPGSTANPVIKKPGTDFKVPANDPVEREYLKILAEDNSAQAEIDKWIEEANEFAQKGATLPQATLKSRIDQRLKPVQDLYDRFLEKNPKHTAARLAYGSFLMDVRDEEGAEQQWEKARKLDPANPAAWNNLANHYGHRGPVKKAFEYYEKAIDLNPNESVYYQNFATTVYLFRKDAMEYFKIEEQKVFDRALDLYQKALKLDPANFPLATDWAQTYYGIKPPRLEEALNAWRAVHKIARDDIERQGVEVHLARVQINRGEFSEARRHLNHVTNDLYGELKRRLTRNLGEKEAKATNAPVSSPVK